MRKRLPTGIVLALFLVCIAAAVVLTAASVRGRFNRMLGDLPEKQERYEILDELDSIIAKNYFGSSDTATLQHAIANGYVSGLSDQYSKLLSAEDYAAYTAEINGEMPGIGVSYTAADSGKLKVDEVLPGSPAEEAGLSAGDVILAVDAIRLDASNVDELTAQLENNKVSTVTVTYRRNKQETTVELPKGYEASSVSSKTYKDLGYLKITDFYATTAAQVQSAVDMLLASGVRALIVDLRDNASVNYENAVRVLDVFVPLSDDAPAATLINKAGDVVHTYATTAGEINLPMAVLVSGGTQAAAELVACDLRDFGKAQLVGSKTKGIALARETFTLSTGDALLLSVGEMLPMKRESYNGKGLSPDVSAALEEKTNKLSKDSQFLAAAALFQTEEGA